MNAKELQELARQYMQVWNAGSIHLLDNYACKDLVVSYSHFEKPYTGIEAYKTVLRQTHTYFPDLALSIQQLIPSEKEIVLPYAGPIQVLTRVVPCLE